MEIERKFLVDKRRMHELTFSSESLIKQGYLSSNPTVRVRIKDNRGFLTIKSSMDGISRQEFEYEIPLDDAEKLLRLCGRDVLRKYRRTLEHGGHVWEVDFFAGRLAGLVMAEVELKSADEQIILPEWIRHEVSSDKRYANANLVKIEDWSRRPWRKA